MPEQSARLGIPLPLGNENVSRQAIREMLQAVDEHAETIPGAQAKADAAEVAAKAYGDSAAGSAAGAVASALAAHKADFTQQIPYAVTAGSANAYTAATTPALPALVAGVAITVKFHAANTGASTLNWNGKGAKAIKNPDGTNVESGDLAVGGVFTLRYDGTNFILQGKGGVKLTGNATAADVLNGKTFYSTDPKTKITGTIPSKSAQTYTPGTTNQAITAGQYLSGVQTIAGSPNLIPENIKNGVNIFGQVGVLKEVLFESGIGFEIYTIETDNWSNTNPSTVDRAVELRAGGVVTAKWRIRIYNGYGPTSQVELYKNDLLIFNKHITNTNTDESGEFLLEVNKGDVFRIIVRKAPLMYSSASLGFYCNSDPFPLYQVIS